MAVVSIGPVNWGSYSGEDLETAMAVLLFQERGTAWRRAPSQGDGGVDVVVPCADGGYEVNQIKRFTDRLTTGQKAQIKKSLETVMRDPRLGRPIRRWNLVVPLDPTSEDEVWFAELTAEAPFACQWLGKVFWDSEASKYPYVIDYFFRDGKERLLGRVKILHALLADPEGPARPGDVVEALGRLRAELNDTDPYYRYDYAATGAPPRPNPRPGLVMSETRGVEGGGFVTIDVWARFPQATQDRPVAGTLSIAIVDPEHDIDLSEDFRAFFDYGRRLEVPEGALRGFEVDAPGGLGGKFEGGQAVVGPRSVPLPQPHRLELELIGPDDRVIVPITVNVVDMTVGERGIEFVGVESSGAFDFDCRIDRPAGTSRKSAAEWRLCQRSLFGLPVASTMPAIRFMYRVCAPNRLRMTIMNGPAVVASAERELDEADNVTEKVSFEFAELLTSLQPHTPLPILLPEQVTADEWQEISHAARLLSGETVNIGSAKMELVVPNDQLPAVARAVEAGVPIETSVPLVVGLGGTQIPLGMAHDVFTGTRIESVEDRGETRALVLVVEMVEERLVAPAM